MCVKRGTLILILALAPEILSAGIFSHGKEDPLDRLLRGSLGSANASKPTTPKFFAANISRSNRRIRAGQDLYITTTPENVDLFYRMQGRSEGAIFAFDRSMKTDSYAVGAVTFSESAPNSIQVGRLAGDPNSPLLGRRLLETLYQAVPDRNISGAFGWKNAARAHELETLMTSRMRAGVNPIVTIEDLSTVPTFNALLAHRRFQPRAYGYSSMRQLEGDAKDLMTAFQNIGEITFTKPGYIKYADPIHNLDDFIFEIQIRNSPIPPPEHL